MLDISFSCDDEDNTKDCFEYDFLNWEAFKTFGSYPIDCNSTAVQNGTVEVVCYKIVFNFGLAAGADCVHHKNVSWNSVPCCSFGDYYCSSHLLTCLLFDK